MNTPKSTFLNCLLAGAACALGLALPLTTHGAQPWPSRALTIVVPYPPGGLTDTVTRVVAEELSGVVGQPVIVENKPGGNGQIGLNAVLNAPKDGHTLALVVPATMITLPLTQPNYRIKPMEQLAPITIAVDTFLTLVVSPELKLQTLADFTAYAKAHPGELNYGAPGAGSSFHFNNVMMAQKLGIDTTFIPYTGENPVLLDVAGGHLHYALVSNSGKAYIESGKIRPLAVTANERVVSLPDIPTFKEQGVEFTSDGWVGYAAAAGTPEPVLDRLNAAFVKALSAPGVKEKLTGMGYAVVANTRGEFVDLIKTRGQDYEDIIKSGAISLKE